MPDEPGVTPTSPTGTETAPDAHLVESAPVPDTTSVIAGGDLPPASDRPVENLAAEMHRKLTKLERQLDALTQYQQAARNQPPQTGTTEPTDDQLWQMAQQGSREAFDLYMQRVAARTTGTQLAQARVSQLVGGQLQALAQKYPVLQDSTHPLTQTVQQAYALLVGQGYPQNQATLLDAIKTAIADRPDLVAEMHGAAIARGDVGRQSAARVAQTGQTPVAGRTSPPQRQPQARPLTKEQALLAARMGIKDPQKALAEFKRRHAQGTSQLGAVGQHFQEEDLG